MGLMSSSLIVGCMQRWAMKYYDIKLDGDSCRCVATDLNETQTRMHARSHDLSTYRPAGRPSVEPREKQRNFSRGPFTRRRGVQKNDGGAAQFAPYSSVRVKVLLASLPACLLVCSLGCTFARWLACLPFCLRTYLAACSPACRCELYRHSANLSVSGRRQRVEIW